MRSKPCLTLDDALKMVAACRKARTAALRERPSSAFAKRVAERPGFLAVPNCLGVPGGIPIIYQEECIGGVGVSGIGEHDEPVAQAGADAVASDRPKRSETSRRKAR